MNQIDYIFFINFHHLIIINYLHNNEFNSLLNYTYSSISIIRSRACLPNILLKLSDLRKI